MSNLVITAANTALLSKQQVLFNRLIKQIENLKNLIKLDAIKNDELVKIVAETIYPKQQQLHKKQFELLVKIDKASRLHKLPNSVKDKICSIMEYFFDDIFENQLPTPEQIALHDRWFEKSYKEELEEQLEEGRAEIEQMVKEKFGFDIDFSDFESSPVDYEKFQEELHQKLLNGHFDAKNKKAEKKQTLKEFENEEKLKQINEIKNKSLRSIYIDLVKLLHPDTETNEDAKIEKEELMKQVTVAYENKDLATLLALEMQWINRSSEHLQQLTDEKLALFNKVLKEQIATLKKEQMAQKFHPKYETIEDYKHLKLESAKLKIKTKEREFKKVIKGLEESIEETKYMEQNSYKFELIIDRFTNIYQDEDEFGIDMDMFLKMFR